MKRAIVMTATPGSRIPRNREESAASGAATSGAVVSPAGSQAFRAWWLGQAGFLFEGGGLRILVDPYLSDSLAKKYRGKIYPHSRMSPPPVLPEELFDIDFVLVSHAHSDHLDPETLLVIAANNPSCRFVIPESCLATALERGIPAGMIETVNAGDRIGMGAGSNSLSAIPSAHEDLSKDAEGHFLHLGYVLNLGGIVAYHSGDCVPYPALAGTLAGFGPDIAFLPVNGRDAERTANGIVGNFTLAEAVDLVLSLPGSFGVGHHFGLFDFNTIDPDEGNRYLATRPETEGRFILAESGVMLAFAARIDT